MIQKRTLIAVLLTASMVLSGCSALTGEGATYVSETVDVDESTVSQTEFTLEREEWQNRSRDVDVAGEERTINVSTYVRAYTWGEDEAAFAVLSTPQISVANQSMNPIADMSNEETIERLQSGFERQGELKDLDRTGQYTVEAVGEERAVAVFSATAVREEQQADVLIHVTKFEDGEDIVLGAAVQPESAPEVRSDVEAMFEGIDH
jgi:hypothetical protein